jgi:hypothetical protein
VATRQWARRGDVELARLQQAEGGADPAAPAELAIGSAVRVASRIVGPVSRPSLRRSTTIGRVDAPSRR